VVAAASFPLPYATAAQLLDVCDTYGLTIAEVARRNEEALRPEAEVAAGLDAIWDAMARASTRACTPTGCCREC
jgi:L-serine dehydratase